GLPDYHPGSDGGTADGGRGGSGGGGGGGGDARDGVVPPADAAGDGRLPDCPRDILISADTRPDACHVDMGRDLRAPDVTTGPVMLDDGIVGYWSFDQMGTTYPDNSGNGNTLTFYSTQTSVWIPDGMFGGAMDLTLGGTVLGTPVNTSIRSVSTA